GEASMVDRAIEIEDSQYPGQEKQRTLRRGKRQHLHQDISRVRYQAGGAEDEAQKASDRARLKVMPQFQHQRHAIAGGETENGDAFDGGWHGTRNYTGPPLAG